MIGFLMLYMMQKSLVYDSTAVQAVLWYVSKLIAIFGYAWNPLYFALHLK